MTIYEIIMAGIVKFFAFYFVASVAFTAGYVLRGVMYRDTHDDNDNLEIGG